MRIKLAVIGFKHGKTLANNIRTLMQQGVECELVGVCAKNQTPERIAFSSRCGVPFYTDFQKMIHETKPHGVIICTPNHLHLEAVEFCAKNGVAVLIEKPIANTLKEGQAIVDLVYQYKIPALVGFHRRFSPQLNQAKKLISSGEIGKPIGATVIWAIHKPREYFGTTISPSWQTKYELGGGPLMINASHEIDSLRYLFGEIEEIQGVTSNSNRKLSVEDTAAISIKFTSGLIASIFISDCTPSTLSYENTMGENKFYKQYQENCCYFFGSEGTMEFPSFKLKKHNGEKGWQYPVETSKISVADMKLSDPLVEELRHFCDVINLKVPPRATVEDGFRTLEATDKLRRCFKVELAAQSNNISAAVLAKKSIFTIPTSNISLQSFHCSHHPQYSNPILSKL